MSCRLRARSVVISGNLYCGMLYIHRYLRIILYLYIYFIFIYYIISYYMCATLIYSLKLGSHYLANQRINLTNNNFDFFPFQFMQSTLKISTQKTHDDALKYKNKMILTPTIVKSFLFRVVVCELISASSLFPLNYYVCS